MLWNAKDEKMKLLVHLGSPRHETQIDVKETVSLVMHQENRSPAGEKAKDIFQPTRAKVHQVPEELRLLVSLSLAQAVCLPIPRWDSTRQPQLRRVDRAVQALDR